MNSTSTKDAELLNPLLKIAVIAGVENAVRIHIKRGDNLNARDCNGLTPLMLSAVRNNSAICKILLDAGTDIGLLSPAGESALSIAIGAGAYEAASILESAAPSLKNSADLVDSMSQKSDESLVPVCAHTTESSTNVVAINALKTSFEVSTTCTDGFESPSQSTSDFDLFSWEPEENRLPPEADLSVLESANTIQKAINEYKSIDSSENWEDVNAYLPDKSTPLIHAAETDYRERLGKLLLQAIREGSVPLTSIQALSFNDDGSANAETERLLSMVVSDLGAAVDEHPEYCRTNERVKAFFQPEITPDEEDMVADTLAFITGLTSHNSEPLRIYQKEFQQEPLISAEEEIKLGQTMELQIEKALDALATWPQGIRHTLDKGRLVKSEQLPLTWMSVGTTEVQQDLDLVIHSDSASLNATEKYEHDEQVNANDDSHSDISRPPDSHISDFLEALSLLSQFPTCSVLQGEEWHSVRETLSRLKLNRRFLLELAETVNNTSTDSAPQYALAMRAYQRARDQMVAANLKLVFHISKKYMYCGEPLDDLAQAGNIGLLKAVDRFDWRRGFKFSTYATWWIRQSIGRHIADRSRMIRIPVHVYEKFQRFSREIQMFELGTMHKSAFKEIAIRLDMTERQITALQRVVLDPIPIHELAIDELIAIEAQPDFISPDPIDTVLKYELIHAIDKILSTLKPKEAQVLKLRFGIGTEDSHTLDEIGQLHNLTRERIRQIEASALKKLKQPSRMSLFSQMGFDGLLSTTKKDQNYDAAPESLETPLVDKLEQQPVDIYDIREAPSGQEQEQLASIDQFLAQATAKGIPINDDRKGNSGKIWVNFIETSDNYHPKLVRKLLAMGFEFYPGRGYCR